MCEADTLIHKTHIFLKIPQLQDFRDSSSFKVTLFKSAPCPPLEGTNGPSYDCYDGGKWDVE